MATKQSAGLRMSAGVAAAAVGLGVAQLLASFFSPAADVRTAVGTAVVNLTPGPAKEWAIQTFGTADKLFLAVMVILVIAALAALAARWERSRVPLGSLFFVAAGVIGCAAVLARPGASPADLITTLVGIGSAIAVLRLLTSGRIREGVDGTAGADGVDGADRVDGGRRLSLATLGFAAAGLVTGVAGAVLTRLLRSVSGYRDALALPTPAIAPPPPPADVVPKGAGITNFITPNDEFYRIDTALSVPQLSRADWRLRIHGMVDREVTYTFDDLQRFEPIEKTVTLACV